MTLYHNIIMFGYSSSSGQGTGLFGNNASKPAVGGTGLFGGGGGGQAFGSGQPQPQNTSQGLFGQSNTQGVAFGQASQQANTAFGGGNSAFGGGQTTSAFGGNQNQGGLFGQQQPSQQQQGGLFGQQSQQPSNNGTGLFGGGGGAFGQPSQGGAFGQAAQSAQGQGLFGQGGTQNQGGMFGNTGGQPSGGGLFGTVSNAINQSFMGNQQPQQQQNTGFNSSPFGSGQPSQGGLFGSSQPSANSPFGTNTQQNQQGTGFFGGNPQQQQNPNQGSLFGTFAPSSTLQQPGQNSSSPFGQGNPQQGGSAFGTTSIVLGGTNANNNKLGGTSWGVPTNQQPSGTPNIQPVRSKNPKLDAKHLVKCIAALDQFQGCCKEEVRINFIQSGGQQPNISQQPQGNAGFAKPQNSPLTTTPSFGTTSPGNTGGVFPGQPVPIGGSLFGASKPAGQQGSSLFGAPPQQTQNQGAFGQTGGSLFGQQQPQASSFGQQGGSLFGSPSAQPSQPQGGSLFGQPAPQQQTSMFGAQPQSTSAFGGQPQTSAPSLFGGAQQSTPLQAPPSLFTTPGSGPAQSNPSMFGASPQMTPGTSQFGQPGALAPNLLSTPGNFAQMAAPLFQMPQQQMDPSMQLLLPQLLLSALVNQQQGQNQSGAQSNPTLDLVSKMIANLAVNKPAEQNSLFGAAGSSNFLSPTPFDDFLKEEANNKWSKSQERSLFSQA